MIFFSVFDLSGVPIRPFQIFFKEAVISFKYLRLTVQNQLNER